MICNKWKVKLSGEDMSGWPEKNLLGMFLTSAENAKQNISSEKQEVDFSSRFACQQLFALKNYPCCYWKIFCWSDGRGIGYVSVCVMLSKGNRIPQWQVALRANGRPRQIKSNGHLSCWHLKSHLSNYSWCQALRSNQSFQLRNKWCGAGDHGFL